MATHGKGLPFIGKMGEFLDRVLHPTVNKSGHSSAALDVTGRSFFAVNDINTPLVVESGSDNNLLICTGLNAIAGDVIRIMSSANGIKEFEIVVHEAPTANSVILAGYLSAELAAGDTFNHLRAVRELSSPSGATLATVISPPMQIIKNGTIQTVEDSTTPADVVAVPVKIMAADGTNINIVAGDINIQLSAEGTNFDSTRVGDGTGKYAGITADLEMQTHDQGVIDAIADLVSGGLATEAKQDALNALITALNAKDFSTTANQTTEIARLTSILAELVTLNGVDFANQATLQDLENKDFATETTLALLQARDFASQTTLAAMSLKLPATLGSKADAASLAVSMSTEDKANIGATTETAAASDTANSGLNGLLKRIAQNITALSAKLPATLGSKTGANSLSVVLASDQITIPTAPAAKTPTYDQSLVISQASAVTLSAPAGAKWCKIMAGIDNSATLMVCMGSTASATNGMEMQAGRSEDFDVAGNISVIAATTASNQKLFVQWGA